MKLLLALSIFLRHLVHKSHPSLLPLTEQLLDALNSLKRDFSSLWQYLMQDFQDLYHFKYLLRLKPRLMLLNILFLFTSIVLNRTTSPPIHQNHFITGKATRDVKLEENTQFASTLFWIFFWNFYRSKKN